MFAPVISRFLTWCPIYLLSVFFHLWRTTHDYLLTLPSWFPYIWCQQIPITLDCDLYRFIHQVFVRYFSYLGLFFDTHRSSSILINHFKVIHLRLPFTTKNGEPITQWILGTDQLQKSLEVCLQDGLLRSDPNPIPIRCFWQIPASFWFVVFGWDFYLVGKKPWNIGINLMKPWCKHLTERIWWVVKIQKWWYIF